MKYYEIPKFKGCQSLYPMQKAKFVGCHTPHIVHPTLTVSCVKPMA